MKKELSKLLRGKRFKKQPSDNTILGDTRFSKTRDKKSLLHLHRQIYVLRKG
eukprot:m.18975 g.18975  ORF g.18975 m.18975 type:complete len:52 (-) comp6460_c0_seq1:360-515(-)